MTEVVFFGSSKLSAEILERLLDVKSLKIQAVVTRADKPVGRDGTLTPTPVAQIAEATQIPILKPTKLDTEFARENHELLTADLLVVAAYGKIIPESVLGLARLGSLNVHGSLLPKYRGASPLQSAILAGEKVTGVSIMLMDSEMDHGPVLAQKEIEIAKDETYSSLEEKMAASGGELLVQTITQFLADQIKAVPQNHLLATYTKLIKKSDGFFEIETPPSAEELDRMIRGYIPWPNAWTRWKGKIVKFYPEKRLQMEGKKLVSQEEFLRGYPDFPVKQ